MLKTLFSPFSFSPLAMHRFTACLSVVSCNNFYDVSCYAEREKKRETDRHMTDPIQCDIYMTYRNAMAHSYGDDVVEAFVVVAFVARGNAPVSSFLPSSDYEISKTMRKVLAHLKLLSLWPQTKLYFMYIFEDGGPKSRCYDYYYYQRGTKLLKVN